MKTDVIISNFNLGLQNFLEQDIDCLVRVLNEVNISTNFAGHLRPLFQGYNVETEYSGDIDKPNDRKALEIAENRIREIGRHVNRRNIYRLRPDIIIHRRRTNDHNLVVIEVKKDSSSRFEKEYDLIKLEHLTIDYLGNHYNYKLGVAVIFGTSSNAGRYNVRYFQNGIETERDYLI